MDYISAMRQLDGSCAASEDWEMLYWTEDPDILECTWADMIHGPVWKWESTAKYPYFRLRGASVTPQQARDIIMNHCHDIVFRLEYPRSCTPCGWVHPDGTVGVDAVAHKYPKSSEIITEMWSLAVKFPYLDLVAVILSYDMENWRDNVEIGVQLHNGRVKLLKPDAALKLYDEYDNRYGGRSRYKLSPAENPFHDKYYAAPENLGRLRAEYPYTYIDWKYERTFGEFLPRDLEDFRELIRSMGYDV